jgi:uncharacterized protein YcsI (UPF0317 family)
MVVAPDALCAADHPCSRRREERCGSGFGPPVVSGRTEVEDPKTLGIHDLDHPDSGDPVTIKD